MNLWYPAGFWFFYVEILEFVLCSILRTRKRQCVNGMAGLQGWIYIIRSSSEPFGLISLEKSMTRDAFGFTEHLRPSHLVPPLHSLLQPVQSSHSDHQLQYLSKQSLICLFWFQVNIRMQPDSNIWIARARGYHLAIISHVRFFSGIIQLSLNE